MSRYLQGKYCSSKESDHDASCQSLRHDAKVENFPVGQEEWLRHAFAQAKLRCSEGKFH